jgi:hypothetical protein
MLDIGFNDTYSNRKHRLEVHFPAKYSYVVPAPTADSGVRADPAPDLRKVKLCICYEKSKILITSSAVEALSPMK